MPLEQQQEISLRDSIDAAIPSEDSPQDTDAGPPADSPSEPADTSPPKESPPAAKIEIPQFISDAKKPAPKSEPVVPKIVSKPEPTKPLPVEVPHDAGPRAPVSWKPEIRDKWSGLPPEVKAEVTRRESEIQQALQTSAGARELADQFMQTIAPYEAFIRAENSDPFKAIQFMMDTAVALRTTAPAQRAQLVANIINQYGVDVQLLDAALAGQNQQSVSQENQFQTMLQRELAPMKQFMTGLQSQMDVRKQMTQAEASQEIEAFANDPNNEYYLDVADTMADILEAAGRRNVEMSLKTAYDRACLAHPEISKLVVAKQMQSQAASEQAKADSARVAGSSMPSGSPPLVPPNMEEMGLRAAISEAMNRVR